MQSTPGRTQKNNTPLRNQNTRWRQNTRWTKRRKLNERKIRPILHYTRRLQNTQNNCANPKQKRTGHEDDTPNTRNWMQRKPIWKNTSEYTQKRNKMTPKLYLTQSEQPNTHTTNEVQGILLRANYDKTCQANQMKGNLKTHSKIRSTRDKPGTTNTRRQPTALKWAVEEQIHTDTTKKVKLIPLLTTESLKNNRKRQRYTLILPNSQLTQ